MEYLTDFMECVGINDIWEWELLRAAEMKEYGCWDKQRSTNASKTNSGHLKWNTENRNISFMGIYPIHIASIY